MIIDAHVHVGNLLTNEDSTKYLSESFDYSKDNVRTSCTVKELSEHIDKLEAYDKRFGGEGKSLVAAQTIAPNITTLDGVLAKEIDDRIIVFGSIDFNGNITEQLENTPFDRIHGLKLHPIIQQINYNDKRVMEVVEAYSYMDKPILFHAGFHDYNTGLTIKEIENFVDPQKGSELIRSFRNTNFIIGHAGLGDYLSWINATRGLRNVYVDTSMQRKEIIKDLPFIYGENNVLYGSDFPCDNAEWAMFYISKCFGPDSWTRKATFKEGATVYEQYPLLEKVLYKNAAKVLKIKR
jgi:Predicted metal-dependent hydrolase of the TIM-barrel fold